jgi:hypothetical protein
MALGTRMRESEKRRLVWEVALCFALPAYHLFWGVLLSPLLIAGAARGVAYVIIHLLCTVGGCLGLVALVSTLRYLLGKKDRLLWVFVIPATVAGLVSIWTEMTGQFTGLDLNWFSVLTMGAPTLCSAHILWLARQKFRREPPNKPMHATCEDARA